MKLDQAAVVVVGGGIVGVTTAYFLATKGHDVVLLEQRELGHGASGRNLGFLHMQNRHGEYAIELTRAGRALYDDFARTLGPAFEYRSNGSMTFFYTDDQRRVYKEFVEARIADGFKAELLDEQAAHEAAPILPPDVIGATFMPEDGQIRTPKFVRALAQECRRLGVRIYENTPVLGLVRTGSRVSGVRTLHGDVRADKVVWAGGVWSTMLEAEGVTVPIKPHRLGAVMLAPVEERLDKILNGPLAAKQYAHIRNLPSYRDEYFTSSSEDPSLGIEHMECVAKTEDGNLFIGCPMDYPDQLDDRLPAAGLKLAIDSLLRTFPHYRTLQIESAWAGLVPATADSLPIVDEVNELPGLILATGHVYGNLAGPITGRLVAELISGEQPSVSLDELSLYRPSLSTQVDGVIRY
ncbi:glycine/D-amino acid oxidase-like deaminating enzyme [Arthrobacter ulcerisalmonis]|jgi:glycine/D-amino acid oxidase-like deaminating enzyme|nr:FAD-dependent oxidoreductase [Arthrobacter ulcerisalmonis]MDQ0664616.1 glycine/D-amino acid oxidase-like deaminating enzyme [Arthrobacter ulcerisalmonis]